MIPLRFRWCAPAVLLLLVAASASGQRMKGGFYEDETNGYKIKIPAKWESVPVGIDEKWIVGKFLCNREYTSIKTEFPMPHKPFMRVIVFTDEARKNRGIKVEEGAEGAEILRVSLQNPYKDYQDYLKRNQSEGYYVFKEKEEKVAGAPCKQYEIKVEKGTLAPKRIISWVYRNDDGDYAVEFEVLEDHYDKLAPDCYGSLRSFRFIAREAAVGSGGGGTTSGGAPPKPVDEDSGTGLSLIWVNNRTDWKKFSPAERKQKRQAIEQSRWDRSLKALPAGWTSKKSANFLVISHTDEKSTQRVVDAAEACRSWLEKTLGGLNDEYVMKGIIRVCADYEEFDLFRQGSGDTDTTNSREMVVYKDASLGRRGDNEMLFRYMFDQYLRDKDILIYLYCPPWLKNGLSSYLSTAKVAGSKLEFGSDVYENEAVREAVRRGSLKSAKTLMEMTIEDYYKGDYREVEAHSTRLVRYLMEGARSQKHLKDFVINYMKALVVVAEAIDVTGKKVSAGAAPDSEEEEEKRFKERKESGKQNSREIITKVHEQVCVWEPKQWDALEKGFAQTLK